MYYCRNSKNMNKSPIGQLYCPAYSFSAATKTLRRRRPTTAVAAAAVAQCGSGGLPLTRPHGRPQANGGGHIAKLKQFVCVGLRNKAGNIIALWGPN